MTGQKFLTVVAMLALLTGCAPYYYEHGNRGGYYSDGYRGNADYRDGYNGDNDEGAYGMPYRPNGPGSYSRRARRDNYRYYDPYYER